MLLLRATVMCESDVQLLKSFAFLIFLAEFSYCFTEVFVLGDRLTSGDCLIQIFKECQIVTLIEQKASSGCV